MAIAFDQNLGSNDSTSASSLGVVTSATAAAGSRIMVVVSYFTNVGATISGISDGSAYAQDKKVTNGNDFLEIWSRNAAGGLTSGSTITATFSGSTNGGILIGAASFTGIATSSAVDTTSSGTATGTGWNSGSATNTLADALFFGGAGNEAAVTTVPYTAGTGTKVHDRWRTGDAQGFGSAYTIAASIASRSVSGTWASTSTATTGALVIYKADAGAVAAVLPPTFNPLPFMR